MVNFSRKTLDNGLKVIIHEDLSTPLVAVNVLYDVGSRDEDPAKTGFAHLFEHLMFGGSQNAPDFDEPIQSAGGENNAFTNADITNFYDLVPAENLETVLWLESDRMMSLDVSQQALDVQKKVVVEEFKETCLNQPYGDMWHHLAGLAYKKHNYQWPTIGRVVEHIQEAELSDVVDFYKHHYGPNNAILVLSGHVTEREGFDLAEKWFGDIPPIALKERRLIQEDLQEEKRTKTLHANVPLPAIYLGYRMCDRLHPDYYAYDLLSDILANGRSSRFYISLHKELQMFSTIDAYLSGTLDPGLFIIEGKPMHGVGIDEAKQAIQNELQKVIDYPIGEEELEKIRNKTISSLIYSEVSVLNKAISLAYFELLGDINLINEESQAYQSVSTEDIQRVAKALFQDKNCCELIYYPN
jgi:zinc protease